MAEEKKMKLVYMGKKRPKNVKVEIGDNTVTAKFEPFKEKDVPVDLGEVLLKNAGDIFKRLDKDPGKPVKKHQPSTKGYVGDIPANKLKVPLDQKIKEDEKDEEGKGIEDLEKK